LIRVAPGDRLDYHFLYMRRWIVACVVLGACVNNVPQDRATGPDGTVGGARPVPLEAGAGGGAASGKASGIVTYPGGDRIDWKQIELPVDKQGELALKVSWRTPRPGLQVNFDVFDKDHRPVLVKNTRLKRARETRIVAAKGTYFVRIFAPRRGDAGAYELLASFQPDDADKKVDWPQVPVPDPPKLADIPAGPIAAVPCSSHDAKNPECAKVCAWDAPPNWPECVKQAQNKPAPVVPCTIHDPTNPSCTKVCASNAPPAWPACLKPTTKRMVNIAVIGGEIEITIPVGAKQGVNASWRGRVLTGQTAAPLANGAIRITRVDVDKTIARVKLTVDQATQNPYVELLPPAP
jgi:hypothetical protein